MAKFELIYKIDIDGGWFHIYKNNIPIRTIGVYDYPLEEIKEKAISIFDDYVKRYSEPTSEIIKSVEV